MGSLHDHDGGPLSWNRFFNELACWYGAPGVHVPTDDSSKYKSTAMAGGKEAPLGHGPPLVADYSFKFADWAKQDVNNQTWQEIKKTAGLNGDPFEDGDATFGLADLCVFVGPNLSPHKARRYEFNGYVDSIEAIFEQYKEMAHLGLLHPLEVESAQPHV